MMMYTLDLSGHDDGGKAGVERLGGRFISVDAAEAHGRIAATSRRLVFEPEILWVRDETNEVVRKTAI